MDEAGVNYFAEMSPQSMESATYDYGYGLFRFDIFLRANSLTKRIELLQTL